MQTTSLYRCSQAELYSICRLGWKSCEQHLNDFADFKARYDYQYIQNQLTAITDAENMADAQARGAISERLRTQLIEKADECTAAFQRLKRYIEDAYPTNQQKTQFDAAGQQYYTRATAYNWDSVASLNASATRFIADYFNDLTANLNMPMSFQSKFDNLRVEFTQLQQDFLNAEEDAIQKTEAKVTANNQLYSDLIKMFKDGQEIFNKDEAKYKQFVFEQVLNLVGGTSTSGIKGYVTNSNTGQALPNVFVTVIGKNKTTTTDNEGRYEILQVAAGTYSVEFKLEGYEVNIQANYEIKTGIVSKLDAAMVLI